MKTIKTDIVVIGGGAGGLSVAAGAARMGVNVVLFEDSKMGGDCLNTGCPTCSMKTSWVAAVPPCMPSKTIASAPAFIANVVS